MNKITEATLPAIGEVVVLFFEDGSDTIATRELGERLYTQWHWETPTGFIAADMPLLIGWVYYEGTNNV